MNQRLLRPVGVALALSLAALGCGRDDETSSKTTTDTGSGESQAFIDPAADCSDYQATEGINGDTITVGTVRPTSGPAGIYNIVAKGIEKYFEAQNAKGGIKAGDGKQYKVVLEKGDDGYDPSRTPDVVKDLVEQKKIFAMVGEIGTAPNLAVRQYMNDKCVPSIALATGSPDWGHANEYPWYIGGLPSYALEAHGFMQWLKKDKPDAKIAIIYQNDDLGKAFLSTVKKEISGSKITIAGEQSYDIQGGGTTEGATTQLAATGADVFIVAVTGTTCPQTLGFVPADWKPLTYVNITCSGKLSLALAKGRDDGVYSMQATLDPSNPDDAKNPKVQQFFTDGAAVGLTQDEMEGGIVAAGWGFASIFAKALELSKNVTRADVMNAVYSMQKVNFGLMRDDSEATTDGAEDPWIFEALRVVHREGGQWNGVTEMEDFNGKSNTFVG